MALSSTFTATGVSTSQAMVAGERIAYALSGTYVARVILEFSEDNGQSWREVLNTTTTRDSVGFTAKRSGLLRFRCSEYTSGTVTYVLTVAAPIVQEFTSPSGKKPLAITEDGIDVIGALTTTGAATIGGAATVAGAVTVGGSLKLPTDVHVIVGAGAPTNGVTGATATGPGSLYVDITNANLYINGNTKASPTWKLVTRAA